MTSTRPAIRAEGQLPLPWSADPLLIAGSLAARARAASPGALVIPEFAILRGASRIDLAVVHKRIDGWEIKGDLDDVSRLPRQAEAYGRVFNRVTIVAGARLAAHAERLVPAWWGVSLAQGEDVVPLREGSDNQAVDPTAVADLLWRGELVEAVRFVTGRPGRGTRATMAQLLGEAVDSPILTSLVADALRARTASRSAA